MRETPSPRPSGTGSVRQRGARHWEGRYHAAGQRHSIYGPTRGEVEAKLAALTGLPLREAPTPTARRSLKAPPAPRLPVAHVYQRTALRQLVAAVRDVLAGTAPLSELELPLAAAEGVLAEEGGASSAA
jgi:hypothetical protein